MARSTRLGSGFLMPQTGRAQSPHAACALAVDSADPPDKVYPRQCLRQCPQQAGVAVPEQEPPRREWGPCLWVNLQESAAGRHELRTVVLGSIITLIMFSDTPAFCSFNRSGVVTHRPSLRDWSCLITSDSDMPFVTNSITVSTPDFAATAGLWSVAASSAAWWLEFAQTVCPP